jgi:hypothetical protein
MKTWITLVAMLVVAVGLLLGCGDDKKSAAADAGPADGGDTDTDADTDSDADGDCANAIPIEYGTESTEGWINEAGDADYYALEAGAGDFIYLATSANPEDDTEMLDTVISVYTADGSTLLATGDDSVPRYTTDTEMFYHTPEAATLCIKVEEFTTWYGQDPEFDPTWKYDLFVMLLGNTNGGAGNADAEPNDALGEAQALELYTPSSSANTYAFPHGTFADADDADYYSWTMPSDNVSTHIYFQPIGPGGSGDDAAEGYGSTAELGVINLSDTSGNLIASLDATLGSEGLSVPIPGDTEVVLWVQRPDGASAGDNDYYVLRFQNWEGDNPEETESNDTAGEADVIDFDVDRGYIMGYIDSASDVDWFSFVAPTGSHNLSLACGSARSGSGVIDATFAVLDADETELQSETETDTADIWWADSENASDDQVSVAAGSTYYLRVSAADLSSTVSSNFYRCGLYVDVE